MKASTLAFVLLVAIGIAAACAGSQSFELRLQKKNEISELHSEIRQMRRDMELDVEPHPQDVVQMRRVKFVEQARAVCSSNRAISETCADVCTLADHICDNADSICDIAAFLGESDSWAQDKCASAKASCRDAKKKCCTKCSQAKATLTW
jgi:hypothetical protein